LFSSELQVVIACTLLADALWRSGITEELGSLFTFFAFVYGPGTLLSPIWRIAPRITFALRTLR
jgi:hypothetical protein